MLRNCCSRAVLSRGFKTSAGLKEVVIVSAVRTPFGGFMGQLKDTPATKLGMISSDLLTISRLKHCFKFF